MINLIYSKSIIGFDMPRTFNGPMTDEGAIVLRLISAPRHYLDQLLDNKRYRGLINMILGRARRKYKEHGMGVVPLNLLSKEKILDNRELIIRILTDNFVTKNGKKFVIHADQPNRLEPI